MSNIFTVEQINTYIKQMFKKDFLLRNVYVKGEISNCKYHTSGTIYFSLKDETGSLSCVMFSSAQRTLTFRLRDGQQVVAFGAVSVYERSGVYQLYVNQIQLDGLGQLYERFEALKRELSDMGMFSRQYKQPIPRYIRTLGVVTAPTGAAVRDIINITRRRNPGVRIILYPAKVQGEGAAESIVKGIKSLDVLKPDVMIVGRGGGSIEDLWAFNEEIVARAVFECRTPVISAVGHETDTTICDFVADLRAPTPSAGAELAVFDRNQAYMDLLNYRETFRSLMQTHLKECRNNLEQYRLRLSLGSPEHKIREQGRLLAEKEDRMRLLMEKKLEAAKSRLLVKVERMKGLSPLNKLEQGYAFVTDEEGNRINQAGKAAAGESLRIYFADGLLEARTERVVLGDLFGQEEDR